MGDASSPSPCHIVGMSTTYPLVRGHIVVVQTLPLSGAGQPMQRGYIVAEDDPQKALAIIEANFVDADEAASLLGSFPGTALQALELQPGATMRL
jgi:hypothetical protein